MHTTAIVSPSKYGFMMGPVRYLPRGAEVLCDPYAAFWPKNLLSVGFTITIYERKSKQLYAESVSRHARAACAYRLYIAVHAHLPRPRGPAPWS